jgi:hypothetical protein
MMARRASPSIRCLTVQKSWGYMGGEWQEERASTRRHRGGPSNATAAQQQRSPLLRAQWQCTATEAGIKHCQLSHSEISQHAVLKFR